MAGPGRRGGVGEGSSLQLDRPIAARAFPPALPKHKRQHDINSLFAFRTHGLYWKDVSRSGLMTSTSLQTNRALVTKWFQAHSRPTISIPMDAVRLCQGTLNSELLVTIIFRTVNKKSTQLDDRKGNPNVGTRRKRKTFNENRPSGGGGWLHGGSYVEIKCGESLELLTKNALS